MEHIEIEATFQGAMQIRADPYSVGLDHFLAEFEVKSRTLEPICAGLTDSSKEAWRKKPPRAKV